MVSGKRAFWVDLKVEPNLKVETALVKRVSSTGPWQRMRGSTAEGRIWVSWAGQAVRLSLTGNLIF